MVNSSIKVKGNNNKKLIFKNKFKPCKNLNPYTYIMLSCYA